MLFVSGLLDPTMYGAGSLDEGMHRRSIYFRIKRGRVVPFLQAFDLPEPLSSQAQRPATTVSPQALILVNNGVMRNWAESFGKRLQHAYVESTESAIQEGFRVAFQRDATPAELSNSKLFLETQTASYEETHPTNAKMIALADFCQALLCLNEFVYVD
jgi:hypothetical protein